MKLILASKSPRRSELLSKGGYDYEIISSDFDESTVDFGADAVRGVEALARKKAEAVFDKLPPEQRREAVVLGADTIVVLEGRVMGKPTDENDAENMLAGLSGNRHQVYTAVALIGSDKRKVFHEKTDVYFKKLTEKEIIDYIKTGEPADKAGAYGIQGKGGALVEKIEGDYHNVMGLPLTRVSEALSEFEIKPIVK